MLQTSANLPDNKFIDYLIQSGAYSAIKSTLQDLYISQKRPLHPKEWLKDRFRTKLNDFQSRTNWPEEVESLRSRLVCLEDKLAILKREEKQKRRMYYRLVSKKWDESDPLVAAATSSENILASGLEDKPEDSISKNIISPDPLFKLSETEAKLLATIKARKGSQAIDTSSNDNYETSYPCPEDFWSPEPQLQIFQQESGYWDTSELEGRCNFEDPLQSMTVAREEVLLKDDEDLGESYDDTDIVPSDYWKPGFRIDCVNVQRSKSQSSSK